MNKLWLTDKFKHNDINTFIDSIYSLRYFELKHILYLLLREYPRSCPNCFDCRRAIWRLFKTVFSLISFTPLPTLYKTLADLLVSIFWFFFLCVALLYQAPVPLFYPLPLSVSDFNLPFYLPHSVSY